MSFIRRLWATPSDNTEITPVTTHPGFFTTVSSLLSLVVTGLKTLFQDIPEEEDAEYGDILEFGIAGALITALASQAAETDHARRVTEQPAEHTTHHAVQTTLGLRRSRFGKPERYTIKVPADISDDEFRYIETHLIGNPYQHILAIEQSIHQFVVMLSALKRFYQQPIPAHRGSLPYQHFVMLCNTQLPSPLLIAYRESEGQVKEIYAKYFADEDVAAVKRHLSAVNAAYITQSRSGIFNKAPLALLAPDAKEESKIVELRN